MKTLQDFEKQVAQKHGLGNSLVIGHKPVYFHEAALLFGDSQWNGAIDLITDLIDADTEISMETTLRLREELKKLKR